MQSHLKQGAFAGSIRFKKQTSLNYRTVEFQILLDGTDRQRIEVNGPFAVALASIAINRNHGSYLLHRQKIFNNSVAPEKIYENLLGIPLAPDLLAAALLKKNLTQLSGWACGVIDSVEHCENSSLGVKLTRESLKSEKMRLVISASAKNAAQLPAGVAEITAQNVTPKVEFSDAQFSLIAPQNYKSEATRN